MFRILTAFLCSLAAVVSAVEYDLVIYGGSSAAVAAAVQAKRMGHSVVIVCPDQHLGGLSSAGLGATDSGDKSAIGGISHEFYHRLWMFYQKPESWKWTTPPRSDDPQFKDCLGSRGFNHADQTAWNFSPSAAEGVFEDFVKEYDIPVFRGRFLDRENPANAVKKDGTRILSISMTNGETYAGKQFMDTTYEGDLLAAAGVSWTLGRESNAQYNETLNGIQIQSARYHQFVGPVDPYVIPGDPASGLLPCINPDAGGVDGDADDKVQAYCYRMCLTNVPENRVPFEKPADYRELDYELYLRSIEVGQRAFLIMSPMPDGKTDCNNSNAVSTDFIGQNYAYPVASDAERLEIEAAHRRWQQGLMWTLQNHPRVPESIRNNYKAWGLSKDESADTGHWGHKIYVREGRRMVSDFVHTENHCRRILPVEKPVGFGSYNMDSHHCQRYVETLADGRKVVRNEGDVQVSPGGAYPIDYGALVPKRAECVNLTVPVCVSCSHIAYGSIRMEPVFMILGQSAATAACFAIEDHLAIQDVPYDKLAERLTADKQVITRQLNGASVPPTRIDLLPGFVCDDSQAEVTGEWICSNVVLPFVGAGYRHNDNSGQGEKSMKFVIPLKEAGTYDVRISYSINPNRATNIPVDIHTADGVKTVQFNQQTPPECGHLFHSLGKFTFPAGDAVVVLRTDGVNGHVIADSVQLLPSE